MLVKTLTKIWIRILIKILIKIWVKIMIGMLLRSKTYRTEPDTLHLLGLGGGPLGAVALNTKTIGNVLLSSSLRTSNAVESRLRLAFRVPFYPLALLGGLGLMSEECQVSYRIMGPAERNMISA